MYFTYECPACGEELRGSFGDEVYCEACGIVYETDWDYVDEDSITAWIVGRVVVDDSDETIAFGS